MHHIARVLASPLSGVYSTHIDSAQQFGRHWHDTYGFGFIEHGAQEWFSGRGVVRGYPGDVITTNPGEVHDGRPLGPPTRRWRIVYIDADVMTKLTTPEKARAEITSPVIADPMLFRMLQRLFFASRALEHAPDSRAAGGFPRIRGSAGRKLRPADRASWRDTVE